MNKNYLGLFKLIIIVLLTTTVFSYGYFQNFSANADNIPSISSSAAAIAIPAGQKTNFPPQETQPAVVNQVYMVPTSIPILMYHEIGYGPNSLYVAEENFAEQMLYLYNNGYQAVSMAQASKLLAEGKPRDKLVILTFDDGYVTFYTKAWPILKQYNFSATVYVITGYVGIYPNYLNWEQSKELSLNGMEIGCHTMTHPSLPTLDESGLIQQINASKSVLEQNGFTVDAFCYPSGQYNNKTINQVAAAGFKSAVTTSYGVSNSYASPYLLSRLRIASYTNLSGFKKALQTK